MSEPGNHDGWIPFGERPNQLLHPDTAEAVMRMMFERHRGIFGGLLAEALTGQRPVVSRSKPPGTEVEVAR